MYDLKEVKEVRFPVDGGSRSVYITVERILKFKETAGCKGCAGTSAPTVMSGAAAARVCAHQAHDSPVPTITNEHQALYILVTHTSPKNREEAETLAKKGAGRQAAVAHEASWKVKLGRHTKLFGSLTPTRRHHVAPKDAMDMSRLSKKHPAKFK